MRGLLLPYKLRMKQQQQQNTGGLAARQAAVWLLQAVLRRNIGLDEAIAAAFTQPQFAHLSPRDRGFARSIAATSLRRLGQIDAVLRSFQPKRLPPRAGLAQNILRSAAAQMLFLQTPPHAAVSSAVALADTDDDARHYKAMINAVLRRVATDGPAIAARQDAAKLNTPQWLWQSWRAAYGEAAARAIAVAHLEEPPLDFSARDDAVRLAESIGGEVLTTGSVRRPAGGRIEELPGFAGGGWWVQDAAAALPARLLGDIAGLDVLDLCAAPGGKTAQLAAKGAKVTAVDRSPARMRRVSENLARLQLSAECVVADVESWRPAAPASRILLDAPCSATGTIRRHPDIAWRKQPGQIAALTALQDRLLDAALEMLAPGGWLVFCTCSLQPEEGARRIDRLLESGAPLKRLPVQAAEVGGLAELISPEGDLRTLPLHLPALGGMDGFYAARLLRT